MTHIRITTGPFPAVLSPLVVLSPLAGVAALWALTFGPCATTVNAQTTTQIIDSSGVTAGVLDPLEAADDGLGGDYNRFGDFEAPPSAVAGGQEVAIRVKLNRMYIDKNEDRNNGCPVRGSDLPDLSVFENEVRHLGPPGVFSDNAYDAPKFIAAELQCTPFVRDWRRYSQMLWIGV